MSKGAYINKTSKHNEQENRREAEELNHTKMEKGKPLQLLSSRLKNKQTNKKTSESTSTQCASWKAQIPTKTNNTSLQFHYNQVPAVHLAIFYADGQPVTGFLLSLLYVCVKGEKKRRNKLQQSAAGVRRLIQMRSNYEVGGPREGHRIKVHWTLFCLLWPTFIDMNQT